MANLTVGLAFVGILNTNDAGVSWPRTRARAHGDGIHQMFGRRVTSTSMLKRRGGRDAAPPVVAPKGPRHGRDEAAAWIQELALEAVPRWHVEVSLDGGGGTRFQLNIYAEEWGFAFHHARRSSWIRITDIPFVHGRDDFNLLPSTPTLCGVGAFVTGLETAHRIEFARRGATVRSNVALATGAVRKWLVESTDRDLCGNEMHDGIRCTRPKGHDGHHAFENHQGALRWNPANQRPRTES